MTQVGAPITPAQRNSTSGLGGQQAHAAVETELGEESATKLVEGCDEVPGMVDRSDAASDPLHTMSSNELARSRTEMGIQRTLMAADRTLMAWIRTSLSLSSFGFTIYKILQGLQQTGTILPRVDTPRNVGLFLIGLGTIAMVMGVVEYWQVLRELRLLRWIRLRRPVLTMSILMAGLGVVLFIGVILKVL